MPDKPVKAAPKRLTDVQKDRVLFLATQGIPGSDIVKDIGDTTLRTVNGFIQSCINTGKLDPQAYRGKSQASIPSETPLMPPPDLSVPVPPVQEAPFVSQAYVPAPAPVQR